MNCLARQADIVAPPMPPIIAIARIVADQLGVPAKAVMSKSRYRHIAWVRQIAMYIAAVHFGYTLKRIGNRLRRDHTTVLHARERVAQAIAEDLDLVEDLKAILQRLESWQSDPALEVNPQPEPPPAVNPDAVEPGYVRDPRFDELLLSEIWKLRGRGWSVSGLASRYDLPERDVAGIVGAEWWDGPRYPAQGRIAA